MAQKLIDASQIRMPIVPCLVMGLICLSLAALIGIRWVYRDFLIFPFLAFVGLKHLYFAWSAWRDERRTGKVR